MKEIDILDPNVPHEVHYIHMMAYMGIPIGASFYEGVIKKYPDYFPDEIEHRRKWDSVPQSVHDSYWAEYWAFHEELWKDEPKSQGILAEINKTEGQVSFHEAYDRLRPIEKKKEKELHKKYYSKYGL